MREVPKGLSKEVISNLVAANNQTALYSTDRKSDQRLRTVVLGPITLPDLENELIKDHINRCVQYFLRMHVNESEGTTSHDG